MPAFVPKPWQDGPAGHTPMRAVDLIDLEVRVTDHADDQVAEAFAAVRPPPRDATPEILTGNLADLAEEAGDIVLPRTTRFMRVQVDRACRVRIYSTAADRDADAARAIGVDPADNAGLIAEWVFTAAGVIRCSPQPVGSNFDAPVADTLYWRVQNRSGGASAVLVNFTTQRVE